MSGPYRPLRRSPPGGDRSDDSYKSHDRPSSDRVRSRDYDHDDAYSDRGRYRSWSPHGGQYEPGRRHRDGRYEERRQDGYQPPAKRPYRGHDRHDEADYYAESEVVDIPYRGESDASLDGKPVRMLLVRSLKESVSEELFAKGLEKLNIDPGKCVADGPRVGATEGSLRRVLIIRDRQTDKSMHFGFAEYHHISDATAALAKAEELGDKCTISSKAVEISFPHLTVFPRADFGGQERSSRYTVELLSTGAQHKYHDERYYASERMVNSEAPYREDSPVKEAASSSDLVASSGNSNIGSKEKTKKRKAPGVVVPAFLQHWQNKAAELRSEEDRAQADKEEEKVNKANRAPLSGVNAITPAIESPPQTFSVDNAKQKCCYLCACQFQTSEGLQRHLKESAKHADNLANTEATTRGHERLKKANVSPDSTIKLLLPSTPSAIASSVDQRDSAYRDRAAERRKVEAVSGAIDTVPSFSLKNKSLKRGKLSPSTSDSEPTQPSYGKGLGMLQKAGWAPGQGLGSGNGMTAPIEQNLYAAGIGLGHESSKQGDAVEEAERMTKGDRGGFLEKTKEVARQRYEKMA